MSAPDPALVSLVTDIINVRKDLLYLMAANLALVETVCSLAKATTQNDPSELRDKILQLTQKHHQDLLSGLESTSPAFAAILDDRSTDEVEGGLT